MLDASSSTYPRYLLAGPGVDVAGLRSALEPVTPYQVVQGVDALLGGQSEDGGAEPGWILVPHSLDDAVLVALLRRLIRRSGNWSVLLLEPGTDGMTVSPLSPGFHSGLGVVAPHLVTGSSEQGLLSFRHSLKELSRIRHDINNPLTAALAEAQLLLMDLDPGSEEEEAVRIVEEQLRRIRDLVAELTVFRAPPPTVE